MSSPKSTTLEQDDLVVNDEQNGATSKAISKELSPVEMFNEERQSRSRPKSEDKMKLLWEWLQTQGNDLLDAVDMTRDYAEDNPKIMVGVAVAVAAVCSTPPARVVIRWMVRKIFTIFCSAIGTAIGLGLGLGLAAHVYDQLEYWEERKLQPRENEEIQKSGDTVGPLMTMPPLRSRTSSLGSFRNKSGSRMALNRSTALPSSRTATASAEDSAVCVLEDEQTYHSLMVSAGYHTLRYPIGHELHVQQSLRGQVLRADQVPGVNYPLTTCQDVSKWKAVLAMRDLWPTLPHNVQESLGKSIEYILRDFVAMWYCKADAGCKYQDPAELRRTQQKESNGVEPKNLSSTHPHARVMMYSVAVHRPLPFMDALYESCAIIFGNLATRVEHVNVFELLLLKWTRILAHTFKWYRTLRKNVKTKQLAHNVGGSNAADVATSEDVGGFRAKPPPRRSLRKGDYAHVDEVGGGEDDKSRVYVPVSEISMTKEFLFAGKLHRAITFGLDVPSFLFSDANGRECGKPKKAADGSVIIEEYNKTRPNFTDDDVLAARLFETNLLSDCETDYNRVVGHRMVRALVSRGDFGSSIVSTLLTEIMGGCVLTPIMSLFSPDYLNSWIISGLSKSEDAPKEEEKTKSAAGTKIDKPTSVVDEDAPAGAIVEIVREDDKDHLLQQEQCTDGPIEITKTNTAASDEGHRHRAYSDDSFDAGHDSMASPSNANALTADERGLSIDALLVPHTGASSTSPAESPTTQLAGALIELRNFMDYDDCRDARETNHEVNVDWDGDGCRAAVVRLVLVVEAALTHGRCTYKLRNEDGDGAATDDDNLIDVDESDRPVEVTLPEYESATLTQILMEITSDIDAFEERVASEQAMMREKVVDQFENMIPEAYQPTATEQSTLRTLIAAWLHTGQLYRTVSLLVQAHTTILAPYYHKAAYLRSKEKANEFVRQLRSLDRVEIMVDTMSVLASPRLEETSGAALSALVKRSGHHSPGVSLPQHAEQHRGETNIPSSMLSNPFMLASSTPRHLDFNRNESFAASLRSERERRMQSWERIVHEDTEEGVPIIHRTRGASVEDAALHKELHHIARIFYAGTNLVVLRSAARRTSAEVEGGSHSAESAGADGGVNMAMMVVETACPRRRIEVPDDDSSFLLRAQVRHSGGFFNILATDCSHSSFLCAVSLVLLMPWAFTVTREIMIRATSASQPLMTSLP